MAIPPFLQTLFGGNAAASGAAGAGGATRAGLATPTADSIAKAALLSSVNVMNPPQMRAPNTPLPQQGGAINPDLSRVLMQSMLGTQGQLPPGLGQVLAGRM